MSRPQTVNDWLALLAERPADAPVFFFWEGQCRQPVVEFERGCLCVDVETEYIEREGKYQRQLDDYASKQ